ncbi:hypothetical protein BGX34_008767 [Mortierella sp. NVP85]|nr:hypothetical protein BGX34_008767 [Mortierella sp. NVP85]
MALSPPSSVASSSPESPEPPSPDPYARAPFYRHQNTRQAAPRIRTQSGVLSSSIRRIIKALVGSSGVHPLDQAVCSEDPHESVTHSDENVSCGGHAYNCGEGVQSNRGRGRSRNSSFSSFSSMPRQQSNSSSRKSITTTTATPSQAGKSTLNAKQGRASRIGSDSIHSHNTTYSFDDAAKRISSVNSIPGESIHLDFETNNRKNSGHKTRTSVRGNHHSRQHFTGQGVPPTMPPTSSSQQDAIKERIKSVAVEDGSTSRRGSASSTKSQETAVNQTLINLADEVQQDKYEKSDNGMDLSDDDDDNNEEEECDDGLSSFCGSNEHAYDERGNVTCQDYHTTRNAMLTDELELELQRRWQETACLSARHLRRLHCPRFRRQSLLSDTKELVLGNKANSGHSACAPSMLKCAERPSPIRLPEILHLIFQFVVEMTPREKFSQREIYSCMLVCKQWYLVAQKTLWREFRFMEPTRLEKFIDLLKRTETMEYLGIKIQKRQSSSTTKFVRTIANRGQSEVPEEESIMAPSVMQRRIRERASGVKKIVLHKLKQMEDDHIMPLISWFHNLQIIEFYICEKLTDKVVQAIAKNCPQLQQLLMPGCAKVTDSGVSQVALHCPRMRHLDLRACSNVSDESLLLVAKHCPDLWHLNVGRVSSATKVTGRSIVEIAKNTNLNTLGLAGCAMTDDAVIEIAKHARSGLHR